MNFLPMLEFVALNQGNSAGDNKTMYIFLAVLAAAAVIFYLVKNKKKSSATATNGTADTTVIAPTNASNEATVEEDVEKAESTETSDLPYTPGYVTLDGVREQDAAVIMAITSENTGIPIERLCFKSIRRLNQDPVLENIEEQDAAVIMALVSHKTGISLDKLTFNSIRLVEE